MTGHGQQCQCKPSEEVCDGHDSDCDNIPDNEATCAEAGYTCQKGTCACAQECNGTCPDLQTSKWHCGACGNACAAGQICDKGSCVKPTCSPACGTLAECYAIDGGNVCVAKSRALPGGYSIDVTEVTRDQYAEWLSKAPSTAGQPASCNPWNQDYTPSCEWPVGDKGQHPVVCVDWCDAHAYCRGVGKRLCGKIGGGPTGLNDYADATKSQWFAACSSGGQNDYPYGDTYSATTCNGEASATVPVATESDCQSSVNGYGGVYDLSGNVFEWQDSCTADKGYGDLCRSHGGSYADHSITLRCDGVFNHERGLAFSTLGFRCCAP